MNNTSYYICGPDGTGKTSFLKDLYKKKASENIQHIWIRSPKILSKPLMAYCRLVGLTKYKTIDGIRYGKHEFYKSNLVSHVFPILQLIDFKIKWFLTKRKLTSQDILFFDRFSLDTLADLMVGTKRKDLHKTWIGQNFIRMIPINSHILILDVKVETIRKRKKDTLYDENLSLKNEIYRILAKDLDIMLIDNNGAYTDVKEYIFKVLQLD